MALGMVAMQRVEVQIGRETPWAEMVAAVEATIMRTPVRTDWTLSVVDGAGIRASRAGTGGQSDMTEGFMRTLAQDERRLGAVESLRSEWEGRNPLSPDFLQRVRARLVE